MKVAHKKNSRKSDDIASVELPSLEGTGVRMYGEWERGFPRWLIEAGIKPYVPIPIQHDPLLLVPAGEVLFIGSGENKVTQYRMTAESLRRVWERYGPPVQKEKRSVLAECIVESGLFQESPGDSSEQVSEESAKDVRQNGVQRTGKRSSAHSEKKNCKNS